MKFVNLTPHWPLLLGLLLGAGLGALLGYFGQCTSGTCPLTSTWWRGALYGGFMGILFAFPSSKSESPDNSLQNAQVESNREQAPSTARAKH